MKDLSSAYNVDLQQFTRQAGPLSNRRKVVKTLMEPGLLFVFLARIQLELESRGIFAGARLVHLLNLRVTGGELGHGCTIGPGLVVKHPLGVVIGGGTQIGERCTILRNVTFGELNPTSEPDDVVKYPSIGSDCMIGTGASILGAVVVGNNVRIGAHALVLSNIPSESTAVGIPAKRIAHQPKQPEDESLPPLTGRRQGF